MKHEPVKDHAERKRILALIEQCGKEQTMRPIDADELMKAYARFEFCSDMGDAMEMLDNTPTIKTKQVKYFDDDENVWKIGEVIVNSSEKPNNSTTEDSSDVGKE